MPHLIGLGNENDNTALPLATAQGTRIPNSRRGELAPEQMREAVRIVLENHEQRILRSMSSVYNCFGMAFGGRRTCIEPEHVPMILREDGYLEVERAASVMTGDIVIYEYEGEISHVAVVISNEPDLMNADSNMLVMSQWGSHGEYLHDYRDVHYSFGKPVRFYSERRRI